MNTESKWDVPRTEEGLQTILGMLAEARRTGDLQSVARALSELSFLVKWVRSDNDQAPFERSPALAREALAIYRGLGDKKGQITTLMQASPFQPREGLLEEAEILAQELGDDYQIARVMAARARQLGMIDRAKSVALTEEALTIFRRIDNKRGMASCLFSLSITSDNPKDKQSCGFEAARLYRETGDRGEAARAALVALITVHESSDLVAHEPEILLALEDSQADESRFNEGQCYKYLAQIAASKGDIESSARYARWANDMRDSDGQTPMERWKDSVSFCKMLLARYKEAGNKEAIAAFQDEMRKLKAEKPTTGRS